VRWIADQEFALYAASAIAGRGQAGGQPRELLRGRKTFAVLDWRDPKPGLRQIGNVSRMLGRAALARMRRRPAVPSGR
jgi:hypothetical protein